MILRANDNLGSGDLDITVLNDKIKFLFIRDNEFGSVTAAFTIAEREDIKKLRNVLNDVLECGSSDT